MVPYQRPVRCYGRLFVLCLVATVCRTSVAWGQQQAAEPAAAVTAVADTAQEAATPEQDAAYTINTLVISTWYHGGDAGTCRRRWRPGARLAAFA